MSTTDTVVLYSLSLSSQGCKRHGCGSALPVESHVSSIFFRLSRLGQDRRSSTLR